MLKLNNTCRNYPNMTRLLENEIYDRRRAMGISQYILAERVGLTRNCIQQMECHEHIPRIETVFDLMQALDFNKDETAAFLVKYINAYYKDKELQKEFEKKPVGTV